ncbi:MAG: peptidoglycan D,D-transpeptidase FtsI family protein [Candidatus Kapaibacteriota bacterium]
MKAAKERKRITPNYISTGKLLSVVLALTLTALVLIARLVYLQVVKHNYYSDEAQDMQLKKVELKANRGKIVDSRGVLLATNSKSLTIAVDPQIVARNPAKRKKFIELLSKITNTPESYYLKKISDTSIRYVILAKNVPINYKEDINSLDFFGVRVDEVLERIYLYDNLAAHLIGFTNSDGFGISGIEYQYDSLLRGTPGYMFFKRDLKRNFHAGAELPSIKPTDGYNVELTINSDLQNIVEYELKKGIENTQADAGSVIVIDPNTGEILALASAPSYNPNNLSERRPELVRNRAINDEYEPGSTFKMITAAAALEEKLVYPDQMFSGYGGVYQVQGSTIRDVHGLGNITFRQAIEHSSNIVFAQVAAKIPKKTFYKYIRDFGFGLLTDIELPGEARGYIPKPENITITLQRYIGFGYGISTTPLQILAAYCAAANGGILIKPYLVKSIFDNDGNFIFKAKPKKIRRVISKETSDLIKELFTGIVDRGTGKAVKISNLKIAGKTGTSQQLVDGTYSKSKYNASFIGFFPVENPQIAMIVVLDNPKGNYYGGTTAAPIFRNIALRIVNSSDILAKASTTLNPIELKTQNK